MDEKRKQLLLILLMAVLLPGTLLHMGGRSVRKDPPAPSTGVTEETLPEELHLPVKFGVEDIREMELESYIVGVVLAEMPVRFAQEALKAQAVAARTYTCRCLRAGDKHTDAVVCTDSTCCQAYIDPEEYLHQGGTQADVQKVRSAVTATSGQVMTYGGEPIVAAYFSCSGGRTEDASAVWGGQVPYLLSVDSPGEESADHFRDRVYVTKQKLENALQITLPAEGNWIGPTVYTTGGGIASMVIGGECFTGVQLRCLLGLYSTAFSAEQVGDGVYITTMGKGHRVGMSQWGANAMASAGCGYATILRHYYFGISIDKITQIQ